MYFNKRTLGRGNFEESYEFKRMESNTEVTNKKDDRNAPTNGYEELDKMTVPPNKADRDLDMMFNLLNGLWLAPKHKQDWIDSGSDGSKRIDVRGNLRSLTIHSTHSNTYMNLYEGG